MERRQQREQEIENTIGKIRATESTKGVTREAVDEIKEHLIELATKDGLFPLSDFPLDPKVDGNGIMYRLSEDDDHRFALYASVGMPGRGVPPHNHTTWAVIVGVAGDELNRFYERTDDGSVAGEGTLCQFKEETVRFGTGVAFLPEDIHSIHVEGEEKTVHLHMYGLGLEQLHERVMYDQQMGTYKVFPASQDIRAL